MTEVIFMHNDPVKCNIAIIAVLKRKTIGAIFNSQDLLPLPLPGMWLRLVVVAQCLQISTGGGTMPSNLDYITCTTLSNCHMYQISQLASPALHHQVCLCFQFCWWLVLLHHDHPQYLHHPWLRTHHRIDPRHLRLEIVWLQSHFVFLTRFYLQETTTQSCLASSSTGASELISSGSQIFIL